MSDNLFLAIDYGTQSVRAIVFDREGIEVAKSQIAVEPYFSDKPGWAEQHPSYFWDSLCRATRQLLTSHSDLHARLSAVALTTQRATVVNLDSNGQALRPAIVWPDQRRLEQVPKLAGKWRYLIKLAGVSHTVENFQAQCEAAWLARHQPDIWQRTDKYLLLSGYLNYQLSGQFRDSVASQVGYIPFDYKKQRWADDGDWKWQIAPIKRSMLPELVLPGEVIGTVTETASNTTGLPAGIPIIAAGADKACEVLGSGCINEHQACISYGTTATINVTSNRYREPFRFIPPYPSVVKGAYSLEHQIYRGYWMISWFKEQFGQPEQRLAEADGVATEQLLDRLLEQAPAGSNGLVLQPFWSPGVKVPGPEARGAIIGFHDGHTRAHVYRSILEGLGYALRQGRENIDARVGAEISHIVVTGGGSKSTAAMQLTADIFDQEIFASATNETSALGAAICAAVGVGEYSDYPSAVANMCKPGQRYQPIPANAQHYQQVYNKIYRKMYRRLRPLYQSLFALGRN